MLNILVLVSGGGTNLQAIIDYLKANKDVSAKISSVVSNNENAFALKRAENEGIESKYMENNLDLSKNILLYAKFLNIDLIVTAGFLAILSEEIIDEYKNKIINVHPSLLPAFGGKGFYGIKVHEAALNRGVKLSGATVHFISNKIDGGPIILQKSLEVLENDNPQSLQKRIMEKLEWILLPKAIRLISENKVRVKNNIVNISKDE